MVHRSLLFIFVLFIAAAVLTPAFRSAADGVVPYPSVPCNRFVPDPVEGMQVWDPDREPATRQHTDGVICARIIEDGQPALGAPVNIQLPNARRGPSGRGTGFDGVAAFIFYMQSSVEHIIVTGSYRGRLLTTAIDIARTGSELPPPPPATAIPLPTPIPTVVIAQPTPSPSRPTTTAQPTISPPQPTMTPRGRSGRCFDVPEISNCIDGRFNAFWNDNGGLSVFGYPITDERAEINRDSGQSYSTQWFERNRFEKHVDNKAPYDVLLGRLGDEVLRGLGRDWRNEPGNGKPLSGPCEHFEKTDRDVCGPFLAYWNSHGLHDPRLDAYAQSLQLFGLPLTGVKLEANPNGDRVLTQWFERARFEYHPDKPEPFKVLLGLVGRERLAGAVTTPLPLGSATQTP
ncbi:MAG: hypothetical protein NVS4B8_30020 [Herpetosiphon sp.]